jgi:glycerol transport system permease protein
MDRTQNNYAWLFVLPVLVLVAFSAIIPLMTVVNYSVQDVLDANTRFFVGDEWYREILRDPQLHAALGRQLVFSFSVLAVQIPLGIAIALCMPTRGIWVAVTLVLVALPLLVPWNVVGTIWQLFARSDIGLLGVSLNALGIEYNYTRGRWAAWLTVLAMDVWHWTSLVVLLCYSGLRAIPDAYYQAARIDGASRWAVFRHVQLPRLTGVLTIAVLLRFMDSFMIYAEPFVLTGGGPGSTTTFLSQFLTTMAVAQFDIGRAAAFSLIYFLIILAISWVFYTIITRSTKV